jgi:flagellar L-ring protein precursor FlgH
VVEERASEDYQPIYNFPEEEDPSALPSGAIYSSAQVGLFATDRRAARVGDILTIAFTESFSATKSQNAASTKTSSTNLTLPLLSTGTGSELTTGGRAELCGLRHCSAVEFIERSGVGACDPRLAGRQP